MYSRTNLGTSWFTNQTILTKPRPICFCRPRSCRLPFENIAGHLVAFLLHFWGESLGFYCAAMSTSFKKEVVNYRDVDEDELLKKLSEEELQRLEDELEELDPDVSLKR